MSESADLICELNSGAVCVPGVVDFGIYEQEDGPLFELGAAVAIEYVGGDGNVYRHEFRPRSAKVVDIGPAALVILGDFEVTEMGIEEMRTEETNGTTPS